MKYIEKSSLQDPNISIVSYTTLHESKDSQAVKNTMAMQLCRPVRWVELIQLFRKNGMELCVEIGPGAVLARTVRWIDRDIEMMYTDTVERLKKAMSKCQSVHEHIHKTEVNP